MASFLSDAKARLQHNNKLSLAPKDIKNLADIISSEKNVITSSVRLSNDYRKAADALKEWGLAEGDDLADVLPKLSILLGHLADAQARFSDHDGTYRIHFKSVRMREENLAALKKNKETVSGKIVALEKKITKMSSENKDLPTLTTRLQEFRGELISLEHSVANEEARLSDFKRDSVREGLGLRLGAMLELAEKMTIICELGKILVGEVPTDRTPVGGTRGPYYGAAKTQSILEEAQRCLTEVIFNPSAGTLTHDGDLDSHGPSPPQPHADRLYDPPSSGYPAPPQPVQPTQSQPVQPELPAFNFEARRDQAYPTDHKPPPMMAEPSPDPRSHAPLDPSPPSSALPYTQEPPHRTPSSPPRLELDSTYDAKGPSSASFIHLHPDPIAAAAAHLNKQTADDEFYVRGANGQPMSTGPGNVPTEGYEQAYGGSSTTYHEPADQADLQPPRLPRHKPSASSIGGSSTWQEGRTTNAGAFRRTGGGGTPSLSSPARKPAPPEQMPTEDQVATDDPRSSQRGVQPLNVNKRMSRVDMNAHSEELPSYTLPDSRQSPILPTPSNTSGATSSSQNGFASNRYVTNLE